jgi:hypothetical protein
VGDLVDELSLFELLHFFDGVLGLILICVSAYLFQYCM